MPAWMAKLPASSTLHFSVRGRLRNFAVNHEQHPQIHNEKIRYPMFNDAITLVARLVLPLYV
jgi:hypothetical protein